MDYHNGKIYVLRSHQTEDIYIGSTTTKLSKRFHNHKSKFKLWKNEKYPYTTSFELMKYDDVYIELLQGYSCDSKMELHKREGEFIRSVDCVNKNVAGRTRKEYRDENKDKISEQKKEWREENKDIRKEQQKEYYQENKDKRKEYGKEYYQENKDKIKEKNKEYYEANKDKIKIQTKEYRENNKDKKKEYREENKDKLNQKYECDCGGKYTHNHKSRHLKSQKHTKYIISTNNTE
jgi:hypothetical protein